ncbi:PP2C family protein-serine/threonine phosphatase [Labrys monachus]|uniref:Sigma-B regulation protein RsbU (Phosphoserine phosphatase) n=1 Tax=Labrys monachus TaxID=217067 RepID=A0ABU0FAR7_9HYPH|nr:fused response regulator/phosphatase [Labrys monachus]MDQ0391158.1 sigma-B regulation protein RsbU (phosphoserine phosphatase) [Labrys monachus]
MSARHVPLDDLTSGSLKGARVLVADDIEMNRELLVRRLSRLGITNVLQAADGREALDLITSVPLDLVLLDIMMPVMTGFDVLEAMAARGGTERLPVIVISAMNEMDSVVRAIELGAEDFLPKPFEPTLLRARVVTSLEKKRLRDRMREELSRKQAELTEARNLQLAFVPPPHADDSLLIDVVLEPAREVGGDLVDHVVLADGRHMLVLGDVSDKGAGAALVMARTYTLIRALAMRSDASDLFADLAQAAQALNVELSKGNPSCMFVTLLLGVFDPSDGRLAYVNCGHVPPFLRRADGTIERLDVAGGLPLGVIDIAEYKAGEGRLHPGDALLVLSDGVTEAAAPNDVLFGEHGVEAWLAAPPASLASLVSTVRAHEAGGPPSDDVAALLLRFHAVLP